MLIGSLAQLDNLARRTGLSGFVVQSESKASRRSGPWRPTPGRAIVTKKRRLSPKTATAPIGIRDGTRNDPSPGPAVVMDQAVPVTGLDPVVDVEPEAAPPLLEAWPVLERKRPFPVTKGAPIAAHQLSSGAFHE